MWNLKTLIGIIVFLLISVLITVRKPEMHKQAIITDSSYEFVEISAPPSQMGVNTVSTNTGDIGIEPVQPPVVNKTTEPPRQVQPQQKQTTVAQQKPMQAKPKPQTVQNQTSKPKVDVVQPPKAKQKPQVVQQKPVEIQPKEPAQPKQLTEQEEIIAWNKWLSRLQNQVMIDSKVMAPLGTVFKFSFTVDKFGNMSNVKVWSTNPAYTEYAVKMIKPVLMSYRGKPILNFPKGSRRIVNNFNGSFVISRTTKYSSPSDYHDYERVKH